MSFDASGIDPRSRARAWSVAAAALALGAAACASDDSAIEAQAHAEALQLADDSEGEGKRPAPIAWAACPADFLAECAWVPLPLDYADPSGPALPIFASRQLAASGHATKQLWLLQGGPGGSGNVFTEVIPLLTAALGPDVDYYVLEHRGVGESARLGCPEQEAIESEAGTAITPEEWPTCLESLVAEWGDQLAHFTTTNDAHDLAALITRTREPGKQAIVYGISYGTTRALRFLQAHPDTADAVILDSIVSPGVQFLSRYDQQYDQVGKDLAALCAEDEVCGDKLGDDPWAKVSEVLKALANGHCPELGLDVASLRFASTLVSSLELRSHLFPLLYRADRCAPDDVRVVQHYFETVSELLTPPQSYDRSSPALQNHVALSEIWEVPAPSQAELEARCDAQTLCPATSTSIGAVYDSWPRYPHDEYVNKWPDAQLPILSLNGTLDPQTPYETAKVAAEELTAPHQTFVKVPYSPHVVGFASPVKTPNAPPCGLQLLASFVADPTAEVDTSCLDDLVPVSFAVPPEIAQQLFGTEDVWENTAPASELKAAPAAISRRSLERLRDPQRQPLAPLPLAR
ncbi:MAG: alpha/beta fold hydrolase [Polyangiales bacterium]